MLQLLRLSSNEMIACVFYALIAYYWNIYSNISSCTIVKLLLLNVNSCIFHIATVEAIWKFTITTCTIINYNTFTTIICILIINNIPLLLYSHAFVNNLINLKPTSSALGIKLFR